jgi:hypothetical protein
MSNEKIITLSNLDYFHKNLPKKVSALENDKGYITSEDIPNELLDMLNRLYVPNFSNDFSIDFAIEL